MFVAVACGEQNQERLKSVFIFEVTLHEAGQVKFPHCARVHVHDCDCDCDYCLLPVVQSSQHHRLLFGKLFLIS